MKNRNGNEIFRFWSQFLERSFRTVFIILFSFGYEQYFNVIYFFHLFFFLTTKLVLYIHFIYTDRDYGFDYQFLFFFIIILNTVAFRFLPFNLTKQFLKTNLGINVIFNYNTYDMSWFIGTWTIFNRFANVRCMF